MKLIHFYRLGNFFYRYRLYFISKFIYYFQFFLFNSSVPHSCSIGKGTKFGYGGISVVIHARARIGKNCTISQGVTIGGRSKIKEVPIIGNNVFMGAGSKIIGDVNIGDDVVIGANAVVIKSCPSNVILAGVPARIIKTNICVQDFV